MGTGRFEKWVGQHTPSVDPLPLMHTTDGWFFRQIIESGTISLTPCTVFTGESLSYFYYGRPAYRPSYEGATMLDAMALASFVVDGAKTPQPVRIFPFDSGAMKLKLYDDFLHPQMQLDHFRLQPDPDNARRLVQGFFGSNAAYFQGQGLDAIPLSRLDHEARAYHLLIKSPARSTADDRRTSIEFQFSVEVPLSRDSVLAVALPEPWWDDGEISSYVLNDLKAEPLSYETFQANPAEDVRGIMMAVSAYLKKRRLL